MKLVTPELHCQGRHWSVRERLHHRAGTGPVDEILEPEPGWPGSGHHVEIGGPALPEHPDTPLPKLRPKRFTVPSGSAITGSANTVNRQRRLRPSEGFKHSPGARSSKFRSQTRVHSLPGVGKCVSVLDDGL